MTPADAARQTADLYADLHTYADDSFARNYFVPGFRRHLAALGCDSNTALRGTVFLDAGCGGYAGGLAIADASGVRRADRARRRARGPASSK